MEGAGNDAHCKVKTLLHIEEPHQAAAEVSSQKARYLSCNIITRKSNGTDPIPSVSVVLEYSSGPGTQPESLQELWGQSSDFRCQNSLKTLQPQSLSAHPTAGTSCWYHLQPSQELRAPKGSSASHKINSELLDVSQESVPNHQPLLPTAKTVRRVL